jgi:hypothetical protein
MKIKMLQNVPGSVDGLHVTNFKKGKVYDTVELGTDLTKVFLDNKFAEEAKGKVTAEEVEEVKMDTDSPENKMMDEVEENKILADAGIEKVTDKNFRVKERGKGNDKFI